MDPDTAVKLAVYRHFAETGAAPSPGDAAARVRAETGEAFGSPEVLASYRRLREKRVLWLEADGAAIRMAPPFSGVATQHRVEAAGVSYFANCAWDALGIPAALHASAVVRSRCEESGEPLELHLGPDGPSLTDWLFHCQVPAAHWWDDIVFT